MKFVDEVARLEHAYGSFAGILVGKIEIDEGEAVKVVFVGWKDLVGHELEGVIVVGGRVIAQALEGHFLLGHQFTRGFVHLRIVNTQATEDGEGLENRHVQIREGGAVVLVNELGHSNNRPLTVHYWHAQDASRWFRAHL